MVYRDLLKDEIEKLGAVLTKILSDLLGFKQSGSFSTGIKSTQKMLKDKLGLDLDQLIGVDDDALKQTLIHKNLTPNHIEILSKYIEELGVYYISEEPTKGEEYLRKTILLIEFVNRLSNSISFERIHRLEKIEKILKQEKKRP